MGQITLSITKRTAFRDWTQDFSNVYTYTSTAANPDEAGALALIDEMVTFEKTIHATTVSFVYGRCWSSGGSISSNVMIGEKALSGVGSASASTTMDKERAFLIQWPAGVDSRGHAVRLKKWYHTCGIPSGVTVDTNILANTGGLNTTSRNALANTVGTAVSEFGPSNQWILSAISGRQYQDVAVCHRYLEHHQLGDNWR